MHLDIWILLIRLKYLVLIKVNSDSEYGIVSQNGNSTQHPGMLQRKKGKTKGGHGRCEDREEYGGPVQNPSTFNDI